MPIIKSGLLKFKNACLVRTSTLTCLLKILLFIGICQTLKHFFNLKDFWIIPIWFSLTVIIDGFIILKASKIFEKINFNEEEQRKYTLNTEELIKYLNFFPKIRLGRTLFITTIVLILFKPSNCATAFLVANFLGFALLDPLLKRIFNIYTPSIYKNSHYEFRESIDELHKRDISWAGSPAWTAVRSTRQFDNYSNL